jgi:hypothetical protein
MFADGKISADKFIADKRLDEEKSMNLLSPLQKRLDGDAFSG